MASMNYSSTCQNKLSVAPLYYEVFSVTSYQLDARVSDLRSSTRLVGFMSPYLRPWRIGMLPIYLSLTLGRLSYAQY